MPFFLRCADNQMSSLGQANSGMSKVSFLKKKGFTTTPPNPWIMFGWTLLKFLGFQILYESIF